MINKITGQVVIWDKGPKVFADGRHVLQIFGVLAADPETAKRAFHQSWVKHTLLGKYDDDLGLILAGGLPEQREPIPNDINTASSIQQLMLSRMWRV